MITSSVVFLPCSNIEQTLHFYKDVIGLEVAQKQNDNLYIFDTGYGYWGFCQYPDGRKLLSGAQGACLSLNLESIEAVNQKYEQIKDQCKVYKEPGKHPVFPVYSFFVEDSDGYMVEFQIILDDSQPLK